MEVVIEASATDDMFIACHIEVEYPQRNESHIYPFISVRLNIKGALYRKFSPSRVFRSLFTDKVGPIQWQFRISKWEQALLR